MAAGVGVAAGVGAVVDAVDGVDAAVAVCSKGPAAVGVAVAVDADVGVCSRGAAGVDAGSRHTLFGSLVPLLHSVPHQH